MSDNGFQLDMFREAYDKAVAANAKGDVPTARKYFSQAAEIMASIAENSEPPLCEERAERARKLKYIADNLTEKVAASDEKSNGERKFLTSVKPNENITFDDIIGLDEAKAAINRLLIDPLKSPQAYKKYGITAGGFILLEGPAGTGKTTFAKAAACSLGMPFAEINANMLVDSYIGKTGKNIDALFAEARRLSAEKGMPVVLFLDEIDYLAQRRGGENKTAAEAVPALIKQMDGFSTGADNIVLIAATNIKSSLDPAILSRFSHAINIPLPTEAERKLLFAAKLKMLDAADLSALDLDEAAKRSIGFSGRDISQAALDLKNALAARDAGIKNITEPLN
ncbi:MAG: ATP-binding protein, partial [Clostridiales bacterium]|nr:ATP-binding protein [Clostridiales bacterium]